MSHKEEFQKLAQKFQDSDVVQAYRQHVSSILPGSVSDVEELRKRMAFVDTYKNELKAIHNDCMKIISNDGKDKNGKKGKNDGIASLKENHLEFMYLELPDLYDASKMCGIPLGSMMKDYLTYQYLVEKQFSREEYQGFLPLSKDVSKGKAKDEAKDEANKYYTTQAEQFPQSLVETGNFLINSLSSGTLENQTQRTVRIVRKYMYSHCDPKTQEFTEAVSTEKAQDQAQAFQKLEKQTAKKIPTYIDPIWDPKDFYQKMKQIVGKPSKTDDMSNMESALRQAKNIVEPSPLQKKSVMLQTINETFENVCERYEQLGNFNTLVSGLTDRISETTSSFASKITKQIPTQLKKSFQVLTGDMVKPVRRIATMVPIALQHLDQSVNKQLVKPNVDDTKETHEAKIRVQRLAGTLRLLNKSNLAKVISNISMDVTTGLASGGLGATLSAVTETGVNVGVDPFISCWIDDKIASQIVDTHIAYEQYLENIDIHHQNMKKEIANEIEESYLPELGSKEYSEKHMKLLLEQRKYLLGGKIKRYKEEEFEWNVITPYINGKQDDQLKAIIRRGWLAKHGFASASSYVKHQLRQDVAMAYRYLYLRDPEKEITPANIITDPAERKCLWTNWEKSREMGEKAWIRFCFAKALRDADIAIPDYKKTEDIIRLLTGKTAQPQQPQQPQQGQACPNINQFLPQSSVPKNNSGTPGFSLRK